MSKGTFFGNAIRSPFNLLFPGLGGIVAETLQRPGRLAEKTAEGAAQSAKEAEAASKVAVASEAAAVDQRQKAKQFAAVNTPSRGFGSNSLENLSRSFLLRL